ncbi:MAG: hypothetical protein OXG13_14685, partial [Gemmatimonadaceae bacterium]|nr:hypothetical protein [Gemmatimonadaceae bacterium]
LKPAGAASCEADAWQTEESASASAVLHEVTFNSTGYALIEGGEPVPGQAGSDMVKVMVLLTPAPPSAAGVAIPLTVGGGTAEEDDYEVGEELNQGEGAETCPASSTGRDAPRRAPVRARAPSRTSRRTVSGSRLALMRRIAALNRTTRSR